MTQLTEPELRALLTRQEGQFLEFKSAWDLSGAARKPLERKKVRDFIAEYVAAFANAEGGTLVVGVDDDGTISGHGYPPDEVAKFLEVPASRLRSAAGDGPVVAAGQVVSLDGKELIVFEVAPSPSAVMVDGDGFPFRVGDRVIREPQEVINERKQAYRRVGFEQRVRTDAGLDDLDLELVRSLVPNLIRGDLPIPALLEAYGLVLPRAGGIAVTNAALLLFGKAPLSRWHPHLDIRFFRVDGTERRHGGSRNVTQLPRVDLPIAAAIAEAYRNAAQHVRKSEKLHHLFFKEVPEYPDFAWQEAIVNAVAHRDYGDQGRGIEVWFFDDRMEVVSPGELVPPVTLDQLREGTPVHSSRNPLIARVLVEAGIMREEGEGVPRMFAEMSESFLRHPEFDVRDSTFRVILRNTPVFEGPSVEWKQLVERLPLSTPQRRVLLGHPVGFTNEEYRELNQVDRDQAYREIQEMVAMGVLRAEGHGRSATWRISPELHETRAWLEARLPALRTFFATHEVLKNADYRDLIGVARPVATRELGRLVSQGYLLAEGERRGAQYRPGPRLAAGPTK
ncbi:MAG: ATP-binding protein [Anaeromyxobacteraceae bacterium]